MKSFLIFIVATFYIASIFASNLQKDNVELALKLEKNFKKLNKDKDCIPGEVACINGKLAICGASKKFSLQQCNKGMECFVLPLVNNPGVTITCDTKEDRDSRINLKSDSFVKKIMP